MGKLLQPEPEPVVKPRSRPVERVPLVADLQVEYPYAKADCRLCSRPLSRYNPHVICNACIKQERLKAWRRGESRKLSGLLRERRPRNPECPPDGPDVDVRMAEQASSGVRVGPHHPQNGHN